jgi:antitoxin component of MazEF toxin-antitoxin module
MGAIVYNARIVKVGDSACIIIPSSHMKMLNLKIGKLVRITLDNSLYQPMPSDVIAIYKKYIPEINNYSNDEINKFLGAQYKSI